MTALVLRLLLQLRLQLLQQALIAIRALHRQRCNFKRASARCDQFAAQVCKLGMSCGHWASSKD